MLSLVDRGTDERLVDFCGRYMPIITLEVGFGPTESQLDNAVGPKPKYFDFWYVNKAQQCVTQEHTMWISCAIFSRYACWWINNFYWLLEISQMFSVLYLVNFYSHLDVVFVFNE